MKKIYGEYILTVARMEEPKDFKTLVNAYQIIQEQLGNKYKLVIVGDGPQRSEIEENIKSKGLEENIILVGSQDDVDKFYKSAKMFIFSSKSEGLPTVIIEAMSKGLPIVATDAPYGCRDILQNNKYGIITPVGDYQMLAEKTIELLKNKESFKYYSEQSIKRYNDFLPKNIIKEFYKIIDSE